jgi:hypothetical protein
MIRWFTRNVNGFVYAFASSMVTSISSVPKFDRRNRSVIFRASVVLHQADRQAPDVRIALAVVGHPPLLQIGRPWLERQGKAASGHFTEARQGNASPSDHPRTGAPATCRETGSL